MMVYAVVANVRGVRQKNDHGAGEAVRNNLSSPVTSTGRSVPLAWGMAVFTAACGNETERQTHVVDTHASACVDVSHVAATQKDDSR
jgi:hypothetical protein